jgi:uncharacterized linocin/CFP29 family protein
MTVPTMAPTTAPKYTNNLGRDKVHWSEDVWDRIDMAVHDEVMRTRVGAKFLPIRPVPPKTTTVPSDFVTIPSADAGVDAETLTVDEGATTRLIEIWVEFALTPQQVEHETGDVSELGHSTAVTLATRAANILAQSEDLVIFQGINALANPLFTNPTTPPTQGIVRHRGDPSDLGLLNESLPGDPPSTLPTDQIITVLPTSVNPLRYGENTFGAVAQGYATLQGKGQYGPYACALNDVPYADTYAPLATTLIMPADRIKPLVTSGFYGTGTLPAAGGTGLPQGGPQFTGILVSLGGNSMDLVVGLDPTTAFMQQDVDGNYRFRVLERFALRLKDITAVIRLEFQATAASTTPKKS